MMTATHLHKNYIMLRDLYRPVEGRKIFYKS